MTDRISQIHFWRFTALAGLWLTPGMATAQPAVRDTGWTIATGSFSGVQVSIRSELPLPGRRGNAHFLRAVTSGTDTRVVGWDPSRFPIAVAFRHGKGDVISSADSLAFWAILAQMQADIGARLFVPATISPGDDPVDAIVVASSAGSGADGLTLLTWTSRGDIYDVRVFLRDRNTFHDPRIVTHEMMHALGFGHTNAWISVMNPSPARHGRVTSSDVAYAQFAFISRIAAQRLDIWQKLTLAIEREPQNTTGPGYGCRYSDHSAAGAVYLADPPEVRSPGECRFCLCSVP